MRGPLLSIGYGNRTAEDFLAALKLHGVVTLVDIRTTPASRFRPQFSKNALKAILEGVGIGYVFMGETLGGRPPDPTVYTSNEVDYAKVRSKAWFKRGLDDLEALWGNAKGPVAIMCAELDPERCHRSLLVAEALVGRIPVAHIDARGELVEHSPGLFA